MPQIHSYNRSDIGKKRDNNEDYSKSYEPLTSRELNQSGRLYVVADGMGGHQQGEKASSFAVETLLKFYYEAPKIPPEKRLNDIIKQINLKLVEYSEKNLPRGEKTGTTLVVAVIRQGKFLVANVGDSRAYLIRDEKIKQITRDHSFVAEMVRAGTLSEAEARESKYRSRLSRSVGGAADLEVDIHPPTRLRRGDIILLCTDGLTGHVSEKDILQSVHGSAKDIAERLIALANERGGTDNVTASVIKYGDPMALPFGLTTRRLVLTGAGLLALVAFAFFGWLAVSNWTSIFPPPNQTSSPTLTASPSAAASFTLSFSPTVELTLTLAPPATETPSPPINESPALPSTESPPPGVVDCKYIVAPGDYVNRIAGKFGVGGEQVFREDGTQNDMGIIQVGETLIIKGIASDACVNGGGAPGP
ncbi:MAG: protein phosphatase 2C domain-containing protein [Anaerolineales bacterium]|nr:protein phosphatase 2C domain-containing protein [Anaerolineales bacterium]